MVDEIETASKRFLMCFLALFVMMLVHHFAPIKDIHYFKDSKVNLCFAETRTAFAYSITNVPCENLGNIEIR